MRGFFGRLLGQHRPKTKPLFGRSTSQRATPDDLYYCYRLLLRREPDEAGWDDWHKLITRNRITLQMLVDGFIYSDEFNRLQEEGFRPELVELDDFRIFVRKNDFFIGAVIAQTKSYEPYVTAEIRRLLRPGDVFVDIGANIGYFTMLGAALVGTEGEVHAFEPNPDNCALIEKSIAANEFDQVHLYPQAVAEAPQTFKLDVGGTNSNGRIIDFSPQAVPGQATPQLIEAVVLDDTLAGLEKINVIKMDIEGAEPRAWKGMERILARHRPAIVFELSPELIQVTSHVTAESFLERVFGCGYELYVLDSSSSRRSLSIEEIMTRHARSGSTHLDLLAKPTQEGFLPSK